MESNNIQCNEICDTSFLVSIGMPVYNDCKFIEAAIRSLLDQSYTNFELIISDDCSTDGSSEICKLYALKDSRITYIRQNINLGISKNMKFLLNAAKGKYFMWAGNDDKWDKDFIKILKENLDNNRSSISSFCAYSQIDEDDNIIPGRSGISEDYDKPNIYERLIELIKERSDGFGYGLFLREAILNVQFPVWWLVNRKCAYNNIYPSLCFYLTKGNYVLFKSKVLWYNRIKSNENVNHRIPFSNSFFLCYLAFILRKLNLVYCSLISISTAVENGYLMAFKVLPQMLYSWFWIPIGQPFKKYSLYKANKQLDFFI